MITTPAHVRSMGRAPFMQTTTDPVEPDGLALYCFGPLRIVCNGQPVHIGARKAELLLVYLALFPTWHSKESLKEKFWGDVNDTAANRSLTQAIFSIRQKLGAALSSEVIARDGGKIALAKDFRLWIDAHIFSQWADQANSQVALKDAAVMLALYTAEFLPDVYAEWAHPLREHYHDQYYACLAIFAAAARTQQDYATAIDYAKRLLENNPTDEAAHQHLIDCYRRQGQRAKALQQYETCKRQLWEEFGELPSAETERLYKLAKKPLTEPPRTQPSNKFPTFLTSFIGRSAECTMLRRILLEQQSDRSPVARLVTITGVGGCGKTRLAIEVATALRDHADGVWWVDLASTSPTTDLAALLCRILSLHDDPGRQPLAVLTEYLRTRQLLLVIDNCEHLTLPCAALFEQLLRLAPRLQILATSRVAFTLMGGIDIALTPFDLSALPRLDRPGAEVVPAMFALLEANDAIQLFVQRARAAAPLFELTPQNAVSVVQICHATEGIALALELAASGLRHATVETIAAQLAHLFQSHEPQLDDELLAKLEVTIRWSYQLLTETERGFLRSLAVFAGGFTAEAAGLVMVQPGKALAELSLAEREMAAVTGQGMLWNLVKASLVSVEHEPEGARYRLLVPIRQFAWQQLLQHDADLVRTRHLEYFVDQAEMLAPRLYGAGQTSAFDHFEREHENFRVALQWAIETQNRTLALRLGVAMRHFWEVHGHYHEGWELLQQAVALANPDEGDEAARLLYGRALCELGRLARILGDFDQARSLLQTGLRIGMDVEDDRLVSLAYHRLGFTALGDWELAACKDYLLRSLEIDQRLGDQGQLGATLQYLGALHLKLDQPDEARAYYQESVRIRLALGDAHGASAALLGLGMLQRMQGEYDAAEDTLAQSLQMARSVGAKRIEARVLEYLGEMAYARGTLRDAHRSLIEAMTLFHDLMDWRHLCVCAYALAGIALSLHEQDHAVQLAVWANALLSASGLPSEPSLRNLLNQVKDAFASASLSDEVDNRTAKLPQNHNVRDVLLFASAMPLT